jgi:hypothetical protein
MKRLVLLAALAPSTTALADTNLATTSTDRPHIISVRTGLDHALTGQLGYDHVLAPRALGGRLLILGADLTMPWARPDLGDLALRLGATMPLVESGSWKLAARLGPTVRTTDNALARMVAVGADAELVGGYYRRRGFVAAEAGIDWAAATHITNSDAYKMNVYPDAQDGWYRSTGGTIRAGVQGGLSLSSYDIVLRVGRPIAIDLDAQTIPFYAMLGVNVSR